MKRVYHFLRNFLFISLPTLLLIFLFFEFFIFRLILPAAQFPKLEFEPTHLILKPSAEGPREGLRSMGRAAANRINWQVNNEGWVNTQDYHREKRRPRLAVIGDSYVMGMEVDTKASFPHLLNELLIDSMEVYSFGMAGSPLSNYFNMARYVVEKFDPEILVISVVFNDFKESLYDFSTPILRRRFWTYQVGADSLLYENQPDPLSLDEGRLNRLLKSCATGRYLYHNLKVFRLRKYFKAKTVATPLVETVSKQEYQQQQNQLIRKAVEYTLEKFKTEFPKQRIIITLDALRKVISDGRPFQESPSNEYRQLLLEVCRNLDIEVIDFSIPFQQDFQKHQKRFEFDQDSHWNAHAHQLIARVLYDYLNH